MRAHVRLRLTIVGFGIVLACSNSTALRDIDVGLPVRLAPVDTTGMTPGLRLNGGSVLVTLTGAPTVRALEVLERAGLQPPIPVDRPASSVAFPARSATLAGYIPAGGVRAIAELRFVTRIESLVGSVHTSGEARR